MRSLIITITLLTSLNAMGAVECSRVEGERGMRPKNELAIQIAKKLGVKTCNGKRFKDVVKGLGETHNIEESVKEMTVDEVVKSLKK